MKFLPLPLRASTPLLALALLAGLASCNRERMEITETRELSSYSPPAQPMAPSFVRFYDDPPAPPVDPESPPEIPLTWATPPGWTENAEPYPMPDIKKLAGMRFGPDGVGECSFLLKPGESNLVDNVNRWRAQFGQPALTTDEIAKLPTKKLLGRDAVFVSCDGDFKGPGPTPVKKDWRLLGLVMGAPELTFFVKLTGPKDLVTANEAAFEFFCQSISVRH